MSIINSMLQRVKNVKGFDPQANTGAAITGEIIDRRGFNSAAIAYNYAVVTGSPSAAVTALVLQHGDAANMSDAATFATLAAAQDIMVAGCADFHVDLSGAKSYIRVTEDATYTGGSTPGNVKACTVTLGDKEANPPVAETILGR